MESLRGVELVIECEMYRDGRIFPYLYAYIYHAYVEEEKTHKSQVKFKFYNEQKKIEPVEEHEQLRR